MWKSTWILPYAPPLPRAMTTKGTSTWDLCIRFWNIHKKIRELLAWSWTRSWTALNCEREKNFNHFICVLTAYFREGLFSQKCRNLITEVVMTNLQLSPIFFNSYFRCSGSNIKDMAIVESWFGNVWNVHIFLLGSIKKIKVVQLWKKFVSNLRNFKDVRDPENLISKKLFKVFCIN